MASRARWTECCVAAIVLAMAVFPSLAVAQAEEPRERTPDNVAAEETAKLRAELEHLWKAYRKSEAARQEVERQRDLAVAARERAVLAQRMAAQERKKAEAMAHNAEQERQWEQVARKQAEEAREAQQARHRAKSTNGQAKDEAADSFLAQAATSQAGGRNESLPEGTDADEMRRRQELFLRRLREEGRGPREDRGDATRGERRADPAEDGPEGKRRATIKVVEPPPSDATTSNHELTRQLARQEQRLERVERQIDRLLELLSSSRRDEVRNRRERETDGEREAAPPPGSGARRRQSAEMVTLERQLEEVRGQMTDLTAAREQAMGALQQAELELRQVETAREQLARRVQEQQAGLEVLDRKLRETATVGQKLEQRRRGQLEQSRERRESRRPVSPSGSPI